MPTRPKLLDDQHFDCLPNEAVRRIDSFLNEKNALEDLRRSWSAYAKALKSDVSVIIAAREEGVFQGLYLIDSQVLPALPISRGIPAPNRWSASPLIRKRISPPAPQYVPRHFGERRNYPSPAALQFYSQFPYEGWLDFPILLDGVFVAKITFMHDGLVPSPRYLAEADEMLQPLKGRWLMMDRFAAFRREILAAERARLAGDLHDTVLNSISGILMQTEEMRARFKTSDHDGLHAVAQIEKLALVGIGESRRALTAWSEEDTSSEHLVKKLRQLAASVTVPGRATCRLLVLGGVPWIAHTAAEEILRIAKEAVSNALRHGQATRITIRLGHTGRHLSLTVRDNGQGFPGPARKGKGLGLPSLVRRAGRLRGRVRLFSLPGRGATVALRIRIDQTEGRRSHPEVAPKLERIRILIVEDHALAREGIKTILHNSPDLEVCADVGTAEEALRTLANVKPDVFLVDIRLPGRDGLSLIRDLRARQPDARILVLTVVDTDDLIAQATQAGAAGYLLKTTDAPTIRDAIRQVHAGATFLGPEILAKIGARLGEKPISAREREVLALAARGQSNKEIAESLHVGLRTVKTHLERAFEKLGAQSRTEAAQIAAARGLIHH